MKIIVASKNQVKVDAVKEELIEKMSSALLSEKNLAKGWFSKLEDKAWSHL
ncbi:MAG: hypothetical protein AB1467_01300 [Candidatus Diapherotrites archaeon]